jgi:hypothetical protein
MTALVAGIRIARRRVKGGIHLADRAGSEAPRDCRVGRWPTIEAANRGVAGIPTFGFAGERPVRGTLSSISIWDEIASSQTNLASYRRGLGAWSDWEDEQMVSTDHFRQELRAQLGRAAAKGHIDILINSGELFAPSPEAVPAPILAATPCKRSSGWAIRWFSTAPTVQG